MEVSKELKDSIVEFIVLTMENGKARGDLFKAMSKMHTNADIQAQNMMANHDFEEAAKQYLLISKALRKALERSSFKEADYLVETMVGTAVDWRNRARQVFGHARDYYFNQADLYSLEDDYEQSTKYTNIGETMAIKMESEEFIESLDSEIGTTYKQINIEAYAEWGTRKGRDLLQTISRIFKPKPKPRPPEQMPEIEEVSQRKEEEHTLPLSPSEIFEKIKIRNKYKPSSWRKNYWDWSIYLDAEQRIINRIESVTYHLHSTFPKPVRTKRNPSQNFELSTSGWGEFQIKVDINLKSGETFSKYHWLDLGGKTAK